MQGPKHYLCFSNPSISAVMKNPVTACMLLSAPCILLNPSPLSATIRPFFVFRFQRISPFLSLYKVKECVFVFGTYTQITFFWAAVLLFACFAMLDFAWIVDMCKCTNYLLPQNFFSKIFGNWYFYALLCPRSYEQKVFFFGVEKRKQVSKAFNPLTGQTKACCVFYPPENLSVRSGVSFFYPALTANWHGWLRRQHHKTVNPSEEWTKWFSTTPSCLVQVSLVKCDKERPVTSKGDCELSAKKDFAESRQSGTMAGCNRQKAYSS